MGSRTIMKQQIIRQIVLEEEKLHKEISNVADGINCNFYKGLWNSISQNNETLPSLTSTIVASEKNFGYYKPFMDSPNNINFTKDINNINSDEFPFVGNDYNEQLNKNDSTYLLHNMCSVDNKYNLQSFNIENTLDVNGYNIQYHNLSNKNVHVGQIQDMYADKTSFSCPVTGDQTMHSSNSRHMNNCNSAITGGMTEAKLTKQKDRTKKESHNRIERKRRDFINHQILELSHLLPSQMMTEGESKKNKGNILKNSVAYIQHLKNDTMHIPRFVKETDLAFMLVDSYRKQIMDLQQQLKSVTSKEVSLSYDCQNVSNNYNEYLLLHEQNRMTYQSNNQLSASSYTISPLSPLENGSAFKVEPSSAPSSFDNNSLSTTYRIDEVTGVEYHSLNDVLPQKIDPQHLDSKFSSLSSTHNDSFFTGETYL